MLSVGGRFGSESHLRFCKTRVADVADVAVPVAAPAVVVAEVAVAAVLVADHDVVVAVVAVPVAAPAVVVLADVAVGAAS